MDIHNADWLARLRIDHRQKVTLQRSFYPYTKVRKQLNIRGTLRYKFCFGIIKESDAYVPYHLVGWGLYESKQEGFGPNYNALLRITFVRNTLSSCSH